MTVDDNSANPADSEAHVAYNSLAALRSAHMSLRVSVAEAKTERDAANIRLRIRTFLNDGRKTGAFLSDPRERRAAQDVLDYWSAELAATSSDALPEEIKPILLEPEAPERKANRSDHPELVSKADQRALVRLSAFAREWIAQDRDTGYLLEGDAIIQAAKYREYDTLIDELVVASEHEVEERRNRIRKRLLRWAGYSAGSVILMVAAVATFLYWQFLLLPGQRDSYISELKKTTDTDRQREVLMWLNKYQPWMPPHDLSGIRLIKNVNLNGLRLYAPNFSTVSFTGVSFKKGQLTGSVFNDTKFSFDGETKNFNDFGEAVLSQAQFKNAKIAFTSFAEANLYRAIFDRSVLCNVDFSGASLRSASFWSVTLDDETKEHLKNTAWWQASGWSWAEIESLASPHSVNVGKPDASDKLLIARLRTSKVFRDDVDIPIKRLRLTEPSTMARSVALNDLAWTRAIWGVDVAGPKRVEPLDPCAASGVPPDALQAARQAVCIVKKHNDLGPGAGTYAELLGNLQDTLAYILLQSGDSQQALEVYETIKRDHPEIVESGEVIFRYAIAQYATGNKEDGLNNFKIAIMDKRYRPSHELQTLKRYIFPNIDLRRLLKMSIDELWPEIPEQTCPTAKGR